MGSATLAVYLAVSRLVGPIARLILSRRKARGREDPDRIGERLGRPGRARPEGALVWVHCASVGEATSALPLIEAMQAQNPAAHILMTTGTVTSARRMADVLPDRVIHQYVPVDTASAVSAFLGHWRPDLAIWIESELWPCLIIQTHRQGIPMALVNTRLSQRSHARWRRVPGMARALLDAFDLVLAQDAETVDRLGDLGRVARFAGNLKAAISVPKHDPDELRQIKTDLGARPVWLAASTHPGEEEVIAAAHRLILDREPDALLILAPRHPERAGDVATILHDQGLAFTHRSGGSTPAAHAVWLADTMGEMGLWYHLAPVTFVAGTLTDRGGHTPFEPALCGSAVLHGPDTRNFAPAFQALGRTGGAVAVETAPAIADAVVGLLSDIPKRTAMTASAQVASAELCPDVPAIAAELLRLMGPR